MKRIAVVLLSFVMLSIMQQMNFAKLLRIIAAI